MRETNPLVDPQQLKWLARVNQTAKKKKDNRAVVVPHYFNEPGPHLYWKWQ